MESFEMPPAMIPLWSTRFHIRVGYETARATRFMPTETYAVQFGMPHLGKRNADALEPIQYAVQFLVTWDANKSSNFAISGPSGHFHSMLFTSLREE